MAVDYGGQVDSSSLSSYLPKPAEPSALERIRGAALESFAANGIAATTLRSVAQDAGVSPGLVQHHFQTKAGLRSAVDEHVLAVIAEAVVATPLPEPPADPFAELGHRVTSIQREHPAVARYLARTIVDGDDIALTIFDSLVALSSGLWDQFDAQGMLRPGIDKTWAALHSVTLIIGSVMLAPAIDRHLPESWTAPAQLTRWDNSMYGLLHHGLFRPADDGGMAEGGADRVGKR